MNSSLALASLFGGAAVYLAFAACGQGASQLRSIQRQGADAATLGAGGFMSPVPDAHAQPATNGSRLKARYLMAEDGSRQFLGWFDSARGESCFFTTAPDGVTRCLPFIPTQVSKPFSGAYGDAACTRRVEQRQANPSACSQAAPLFLYEQRGSACQPDFHFYEWGEPFTGTFYAALSNGTCVAASSVANLYYVGPEVSASHWAAYVAATEQRD